MLIKIVFLLIFYCQIMIIKKYFAIFTKTLIKKKLKKALLPLYNTNIHLLFIVCNKSNKINNYIVDICKYIYYKIIILLNYIKFDFL